MTATDAILATLAGLVGGLLLAAACEPGEGPRGPKGNEGLRGPQGPPGPPGTIDVYVVEGGGEETARAWCDLGEVVLGGGCSADLSDLTETAPDVVDGAVRGWRCRASGAGDSLAAYALCAVQE